MSIFKKRTEVNNSNLSSNEDEELLKKFEALQSEKIEKATHKKVHVKVRNSCGCGSGYYDYTMEVPVDSPVSDGDYMEDFTADAINIEEE